jgi:hypothetical protein
MKTQIILFVLHVLWRWLFEYPNVWEIFVPGYSSYKTYELYPYTNYIRSFDFCWPLVTMMFHLLLLSYYFLKFNIHATENFRSYLYTSILKMGKVAILSDVSIWRKYKWQFWTPSFSFFFLKWKWITKPFKIWKVNLGGILMAKSLDFWNWCWWKYWKVKFLHLHGMGCH